MATMSNFIGKLENYGDLEVSIIRSTKINKVLKALIKLNTIPKDEEFNFKGRSVDLLGRWNKALGADSTADETAGPSGIDKDDQPATNGVHKEDKESSDEQKEAVAAVTDAVRDAEITPDTPVEAKETGADEAMEDAAPAAKAEVDGDVAASEAS
jgi:hypothetical protein